MSAAIWHDLECGSYRQDLPLWHELARTYGGPVLDVGAGTGRVSLNLARAGIEVVALDSDPLLLAELSARADGLPVRTAVADARSFSLNARFPLIIVPMQTIQLLGGSAGRRLFLSAARDHLADGGALAIALADAEDFEEFQWHKGDPVPLPDVDERDGIVYNSQPTAVRRDGTVFVLERERSTVSPEGLLERTQDSITLDALSLGELDADAVACGLELRDRRLIEPTAEHIGSQVVIAGA